MISSGKIILVSAASVSVLGLATLKAPASVLLFNFGGAAVSAASATDSPGYASGAWSASTPTWNSVGDSDININGAGGTVYYYDGTSAGSAQSGVGVDLAGAPPNGTSYPSTITFGNTTNNPNAVNPHPGGSGNFAAGAPAGGVTLESSGNNNTITGAEITGLAPGAYEVFVVSDNDFYNGNDPEYVWINDTSPGGTYNVPSTTLALTEANPSNTNSATTWTQNSDYVETLVTVSTNSAIAVVAEGDSVSEMRGLINSIEIVSATPEPGTVGLMGFVACGMLLHRRRARHEVAK